MNKNYFLIIAFIALCLVIMGKSISYFGNSDLDKELLNKELLTNSDSLNIPFLKGIENTVFSKFGMNGSEKYGHATVSYLNRSNEREKLFVEWETIKKEVFIRKIGGRLNNKYSVIFVNDIN